MQEALQHCTVEDHTLQSKRDGLMLFLFTALDIFSYAAYYYPTGLVILKS